MSQHGHFPKSFSPDCSSHRKGLILIILLFNAACFMLMTFVSGPSSNNGVGTSIGLIQRSGSIRRTAPGRPSSLRSDSMTANRKSAQVINSAGSRDAPRGHVTVCDPAMTVVTVACGSRIDEAVNLVKSILLFTRCKIFIIVFADKADMAVTAVRFDELIKAPLFGKLAVTLTVMEAAYPARISSETEWRNLYSACSTFRLFLPVPKLDATVHYT